jgi:hypothetical protein
MTPDQRQRLIRETKARFLGTLSIVQQSRGADADASWIERVQRAMLAAVNGVRAGRGVDLVALADIARVERSAIGHSDYSHKFALHCAELAWRSDDDEPG